MGLGSGGGGGREVPPVPSAPVHVNNYIYTHYNVIVTSIKSLDKYTCIVIHFCYRLISFSEFRTFESLLCTPDVISQLAFKVFDTDNKGRITFGEDMV